MCILDYKYHIFTCALLYQGIQCFQAVLALVYLVLPGNVGSILNLTGFVVWGSYGLIMAAHIMFKFQKETKDTPRVVRVRKLIAGIFIEFFNESNFVFNIFSPKN